MDCNDKDEIGELKEISHAQILRALKEGQAEGRCPYCHHRELIISAIAGYLYATETALDGRVIDSVGIKDFVDEVVNTAINDTAGIGPRGTTH